MVLVKANAVTEKKFIFKEALYGGRKIVREMND